MRRRRSPSVADGACRRRSEVEAHKRPWERARARRSAAEKMNQKRAEVGAQWPRDAPGGGPRTSRRRRRRGGLEARAAVGLLQAAKPHTVQMLLSMTTDPRGWLTRRGERERVRAATKEARESEGGEGAERSSLEGADPSAVRMARCTASSWTARAESCAMSSLKAVPRGADMSGERTRQTDKKGCGGRGWRDRRVSSTQSLGTERVERRERQGGSEQSGAKSETRGGVDGRAGSSVR